MDVVSVTCISAVIRSGSLLLPWQQLLGKRMCVRCACRDGFEDQLGFHRSCMCVCLSDVTVRVAAVSCCSRAKHTVLTGLIN